jgi:DNA-binding winged helix-turn-helix (wHTH) protein
MVPARFRFEPFTLDPADRQLCRDGAPVEINARYLDALSLLVREAGKLVSKDRFMDEVWRGVPVTDEALTQCIKTLRRQLGDNASAPRFIETVPKHGYRFIAAVETMAGSGSEGRESEPAPATSHEARAASPSPWAPFLRLGLAGTIGAGVAGIFGGLFYGFAGAGQPLQPGMGAASVVLVLACVTILLALIGGAGVSFGIAAAGMIPGRRWYWSLAGGAAGGLVVGAFVKLIGVDAFNLLFGQTPGDITGAAEGALLGGAIGLAAWATDRAASPAPAASLPRRILAAGALAGGAAGLLIPLLGGRLLGGSLDLLAAQFPTSRLRLDQIGAMFGESGFGPVSQAITGALEGALFGGCLVGAMVLARRHAAQPSRQQDR